jgi:hypothetical protein
MSDNKDPNLQAPQEANTTKHINFAEDDTDKTSSNSNTHNDNDSPTKKAWEELREENRKNDCEK